MKIADFSLKSVHMVRDALIFQQDGAIWLRSISETPPTCQKGYERSENPSAPAWHLLYNMTILLLLGVLPHVGMRVLHTQ